MKKIQIYLLFVCCFLFIVPTIGLAQEEEKTDEFDGFDVTNKMDEQSAIGALLGYTQIGDQEFIGMRIQPELAIGKIGFGLDVPLMFNVDNGKFRTDEFQDGIGWLRCIRYVRWGVKKRDPVYVRVGDLTGTYIGYGILLDNYSNSISFDKRKTGATFDILIKNFIGVEGLYSDFDLTSSNLLAIRPYVKPFGRTRIPIIRTMDMGFSFVTDHDNTKIKLSDSTDYQNKFIVDGMNAWALDIGIIPISTSFMQLKVYAQYGNLAKNNSTLLRDSINRYVRSPAVSDADSAMMVNYEGSSGYGVGIDFRFKVLGNVLRVDAKLERLWYKKYFMPQFFNAGYEFNKDAKLFGLTNTDGKQGIYGALSITLLDKVMVGGSLMMPDNVSDIAPAVFTLDFDASKLFEKIILQGQYIRGGIINLDDVIALDQRSLLNMRAAYRMYKFLVIGLDYKWTWSKNENGEFKADKYISPYFGFQMPLNFGSRSSSIGTDEEG